jgi:hypothetical protein
MMLDDMFTVLLFVRLYAGDRAVKPDATLPLHIMRRSCPASGEHVI